MGRFRVDWGGMKGEEGCLPGVKRVEQEWWCGRCVKEPGLETQGGGVSMSMRGSSSSKEDYWTS